MSTIERKVIEIVQDAGENEARIEIVHPLEPVENVIESHPPYENIDPILEELTIDYTDF